MMTTRATVKVTIAKVLEVAYSKNKGLTRKIVLKKGNFKVKINEDGKVKIHGSAGAFTFNGGAALEGLGAKLKMASISFSKGDGDDINYKASFSFYGGVGAISVSGSFDIIELISSCSGLLCQAARDIRSRNNSQGRRLQEIMGH